MPRTRFVRRVNLGRTRDLHGYHHHLHHMYTYPSYPTPANNASPAGPSSRNVDDAPHTCPVLTHPAHLQVPSICHSEDNGDNAASSSTQPPSVLTGLSCDSPSSLHSAIARRRILALTLTLADDMPSPSPRDNKVAPLQTHPPSNGDNDNDATTR